MTYRLIYMKHGSFDETAIWRLLKPFFDAGLVQTVEPTTEAHVELICQMINDHSSDHQHFEHLLSRTHSAMTVQELYQHIEKRDDYIPSVYIAKVNENGRLYDFQVPRSIAELKILLETLFVRNELLVPDHLLKSVDRIKATTSRKELDNEVADLIEFCQKKKVLKTIQSRVEDPEIIPLATDDTKKRIQRRNKVNTYAQDLVPALLDTFPNMPIVGISTDLVMEVADLLYGIYEEAAYGAQALSDYLLELNESMLDYRRNYLKHLDTIKADMNRLSYQKRNNIRPAFDTVKSRAESGYSDQCVQAVLSDLDIIDRYYNYTSGYYYSRNKLYTWLSALMQKTVRKLEVTAA